jgi:hypothetical protein
MKLRLIQGGGHSKSFGHATRELHVEEVPSGGTVWISGQENRVVNLMIVERYNGLQGLFL